MTDHGGWRGEDGESECGQRWLPVDETRSEMEREGLGSHLRSKVSENGYRLLAL